MGYAETTAPPVPTGQCPEVLLSEHDVAEIIDSACERDLIDRAARRHGWSATAADRFGLMIHYRRPGQLIRVDYDKDGNVNVGQVTDAHGRGPVCNAHNAAQILQHLRGAI
jgi:hypothetical protein